MTIFHRTLAISAFAGILFFPAPAVCHGPEGHKEEVHKMDAESMKAQHERMATFAEAANMLLDGIIHNAPELAKEGAEKLARSLKGRERDVPHKNRTRINEFQRLYDELEKRTGKLKAAVKADDLPRSAAEYGKVLEVCAACHRKFRD